MSVTSQEPPDKTGRVQQKTVTGFHRVVSPDSSEHKPSSVHLANDFLQVAALSVAVVTERHLSPTTGLFEPTLLLLNTPRLWMPSGSVGNVETTRVRMIRPSNQNVNMPNKSETFNSVVTQQLK